MGFLNDFSYSNTWQNTQAASDFERLPDGNHVASIDNIKYLDGSDGKSECITYEMTIAEGECQGLRFRYFFYIKNTDSFAYLKRDMLKLGCTIPQNPADIMLALQAAIGKVIALHAVTRTVNGKEYQNIYLDGLTASMTPKPAQPQQVVQQPQQVVQQQPQMRQAQPQQPQRMQQQSQQQGRWQAYPQPEPGFPDEYPF